jgi:hypothetical protein
MVSEGADFFTGSELLLYRIESRVFACPGIISPVFAKKTIFLFWPPQDNSSRNPDNTLQEPGPL